MPTPSQKRKKQRLPMTALGSVPNDRALQSELMIIMSSETP